MSYVLKIQKSVTKDLRKLENELREKVLRELATLEESPFAGERLHGKLSRFYSLHFNHNGVQYRLAYEVDPRKKVVLVLLVGPRENFYQKLDRKI